MLSNKIITKGLAICLLMVLLSWAQKRVTLIEDTRDGSTLQFIMLASDYALETSLINGKTYSKIVMPDAVFDEEKGNPHIPQIAQSMIIPDLAKMKLEIVDTKYTDISINTLIPSKGSISRKINPADVPYEFGMNYQNNTWFPSQCARLGRPYIARDFRAQVVYFQPFIYHPKNKILRVYTQITVKVTPTNKTGENIKVRTKPLKIGPNFHRIYSRRLINYNTRKYDPVDEEGTMLIISHADFIETMQPFAAWKNKRGLTTEIVDITTVGSNQQSISAYVADYYKEKDLKYLLLVGDHAQVPSGKDPKKRDPSDNVYGCIEGDDSYVEIFVGRFSGTTTTHIKTQVDKILFYERELKETDTWLNRAYGTYSSSEPDDKKAIAHIKKDLENFTYTTVGSGGSRQDNLIGSIGKGIGLHINSSHGNKTSISGINVRKANNLTNDKQYPFNYTLACDPGSFTSGSDCLGEAVLKKAGGGYIGAFMASISQPWYEPYAGIHEHTDILTEQYPDNIKRTYGGIAHNGCMKMLDEFPRQGPWVSDCWILFGDPSLLIYTDAPKAITIDHPDKIGNGSQEIVVKGTEDATVCIFHAGQNIQEIKKLKNGEAKFKIDVSSVDSLYITATAFNYQTYEGIINVGPTSIDILNGQQTAFPRSSVFIAQPNPVNRNTEAVHFAIKVPYAKASLKIFDGVGNLVYEDLDGTINKWNLMTKERKKVARGVYLAILELRNLQGTVKIYRALLGVK